MSKKEKMKELKNKTTNAKKNKYKNMTARELHIRQQCAHKGRTRYSKESIDHTKECPMCGITEAKRKGVHLHGCHVGLNYKEMMDTTCDLYLNIRCLGKDSDKQHIANILKKFQNYHAGAVQNGKLAIQTACARCNPHLETCTPEKVELLKYKGKEAWLQHINVTGTKQRTPYVGQTTLDFHAISHRLRVDGSSSDTAGELSGESTDDAVGESSEDSMELGLFQEDVISPKKNSKTSKRDSLSGRQPSSRSCRRPILFKADFTNKSYTEILDTLEVAPLTTALEETVSKKNKKRAATPIPKSDFKKQKTHNGASKTGGSRRIEKDVAKQMIKPNVKLATPEQLSVIDEWYRASCVFDKTELTGLHQSAHKFHRTKTSVAKKSFEPFREANHPEFPKLHSKNKLYEYLQEKHGPKYKQGSGTSWFEHLKMKSRPVELNFTPSGSKSSTKRGKYKTRQEPAPLTAAESDVFKAWFDAFCEVVQGSKKHTVSLHMQRQSTNSYEKYCEKERVKPIIKGQFNHAVGTKTGRQVESSGKRGGQMGFFGLEYTAQ